MSTGRLLVDEPADGVVRLTISNPAKRGALDHAILDGIASALEGLDAPCVMLTGEAGMFSAGYDIADIPDDVFAEQAAALVAHPFTRAIDALEAYPRATLAALGGHTIGGALELALVCDLRVAAAGIKLGMPPAKLGLVYSHTGLRRFIDAVGAPRTRELFLRARNIDAPTALDWGLVNEVHQPAELDAAALGVARELASGAPLSIAGNKRVIAALLAARGKLEEQTERELIALREECFQSDDMLEGVRAFGEKRAPCWQGH